LILASQCPVVKVEEKNLTGENLCQFILMGVYKG
jgi:hypothetical protein